MTMALYADPRYLSDRDIDRRYQAPVESSSASTVIDLRERRLRRSRELVGREVDQLRALAPNWDGDGGNVPAFASLELAYRLVIDLMSQGVMRPSIVPVSDGGVTIEWHRGPRQLVLYVPPRGGPVEANYLDEATGEEWERELPADDRVVEERLATFLAV